MCEGSLKKDIINGYFEESVSIIVVLSSCYRRLFKLVSPVRDFHLKH